jgi:hypothetical protein
VLAAVCVVLGLRLWRLAPAASRLLAGVLFLTAIAAAVGGTEHGLRPRLGPGTRWWIWEVTYVAIGAANALLVITAGWLVFGRRGRVLVTAFAALRFAAYVVVLTGNQHFRHVVMDFLVTLSFLALVSFRGLATRQPWGGWLLGAVVASVVGALIQRSGFALHQHFNHNDLFHVVQTLGVWLFYRAGKLFVGPDVDGRSRLTVNSQQSTV